MRFLKTLKVQCMNDPLYAIASFSLAIFMLVAVVCSVVFMVKVV